MTQPVVRSITRDTVFGRILRKEMPCNFIYEDDKCAAFYDIDPQAPIHFLVIPRKPIAQLSLAGDEDAELLGHLLIVGKKIAKDLGMTDGFQVLINDGRNGGQTIYHLHMHFMGHPYTQW